MARRDRQHGHVRPRRHGIEPRQSDGLLGIVLTPFVHGGFGRLLDHTFTSLVLGAAIALSRIARLGVVTAIVALVGGLGTSLVGPENTVHIGASGLFFGFAEYLVARFLHSRRLVNLAVGVLVVAVFGTTLLVGLVPTPGVSWQGHLFGAVGGVVAARLVARRRTKAAAAD